MKKENLAVLKTRAAAIAIESEERLAPSAVIEIIAFSLADETYGIESAYIREIYPLKEFTPLPGVPPYVFGLINIRGQVLAIIELKKLFNLPEKGLGQLNKVIVLHTGAMEFGLLADEVIGNQYIEVRTIQDTPPTISGSGQEYIKGVTNNNLILLDAERLLSDGKLIINQTVD